MRLRFPPGGAWVSQGIASHRWPRPCRLAAGAWGRLASSRRGDHNLLYNRIGVAMRGQSFAWQVILVGASLAVGWTVVPPPIESDTPSLSPIGPPPLATPAIPAVDPYATARNAMVAEGIIGWGGGEPAGRRGLGRGPG